MLNVAPETYEQAIEDWLGEHAQLQVLREAEVCAVAKKDDVVQSIELRANNVSITIHPCAVVDATGTAEIVRMIDPALIVDERHAAGGMIFTLRGVDTGLLRFPKGMALLQSIRTAARTGELPQGCGMVWLDLGVYEDEAYVKLFLPLGVNWGSHDVLSEAEEHGHTMRDALMAFLAGQPGFTAATLVRTGSLGIREGGRVVGEYCLTEHDVRSGQRFKDAIGRCCWPIEYWDSEKGVELEYLPAGTDYEIPLRALKVSNIRNLWVAGKCLSADPLAQASARVVGTCWAMGEGVGRAVMAAH